MFNVSESLVTMKVHIRYDKIKTIMDLSKWQKYVLSIVDFKKAKRINKVINNMKNRK